MCVWETNFEKALQSVLKFIEILSLQTSATETDDEKVNKEKEEKAVKPKKSKMAEKKTEKKAVKVSFFIYGLFLFTSARETYFYF